MPNFIRSILAVRRSAGVILKVHHPTGRTLGPLQNLPQTLPLELTYFIHTCEFLIDVDLTNETTPSLLLNRYSNTIGGPAYLRTLVGPSFANMALALVHDCQDLGIPASQRRNQMWNFVKVKAKVVRLTPALDG